MRLRESLDEEEGRENACDDGSEGGYDDEEWEYETGVEAEDEISPDRIWEHTE